MKKLLMTIISGTLLLSVVGCGGNKKVDNNLQNNVNVQVEENSQEKEEPPVTIEELPMSVTILEPDSIGNTYYYQAFRQTLYYCFIL